MQLIEILRPTAALIAGGAIGLAFGAIQNAAARRNAKLQEDGKFNNAWGSMPGSMRRVALLMIALVLVQIICPMLFVPGTQWWVSAGVGIGYGWRLFAQFRERQQAA